MALYNGSEKFSSQIGIAQYADVTDLMKHMTIEVGDVGQVMLPLNENENKRRYLNGQAILQEQFPRFTAKLKAAVSLYPSIACTESEWQSIRRADPDDQCAKFVIDDENGIIRLPRVKFLCGNLNLYKLAEGIPNRRLVKTIRNGAIWADLYNDGWCEQGGFVNRGMATSFNYYVTLPIPYKDTTFTITAQPTYKNDDHLGESGHNIEEISVNGFRYYFYTGVSADGTSSFFWRTSGYANRDLSGQYNIGTGQFESPYYIQVSTGVDYEVDVTNHITTNSPYSLGMYTRSIGNLNNLSWLKSDGTYHSGTAYPDMYNWILQNYNGIRNDGIEVGLKDNSYCWSSTGGDANFHMWTTHRHPKVGDAVFGYIFQHTIGYVTEIVNEDQFVYNNIITGTNLTCTFDHLDETMWAINDYMYVIDTTNQTFRLPLLVGDEMTPAYDSNNVIEIGAGFFPQYIRSDNRHYYVAPCNGYAILQIDRENSSGYTPNYSVNGIAMQYGPFWVTNFINWNIPLRKGDILRVWTDLAGNNYEYGRRLFVKATNVAPLYFYVGETMQDANLINVGRIVEAGAQLITLVQLSEELRPMRTRYIVEKWENGAEYCYKYNDGWCVQGGRTDFMNWSTSGATQNITLHQEMRDTTYAVSGTMIDYTANWHTPGCAVRVVNTQQIQVGIASAVDRNQGTARCSWEVQGYMAQE